MTISAKTVTTDSLAIQLFEADGNPVEDWGLVDEVTRLCYRKRALEADPSDEYMAKLNEQQPYGRNVEERGKRERSILLELQSQVSGA